MAFTGDLEHLHIVDIIQLVNTTRKSGTFSVKGSRGESRIIFSNGYIVGASHLGKVRIGTVLVKLKAVTLEDLRRALAVQKSAGKDRKPLIVTLIDLGKLKRDQATMGLKKLIEMTLVELIGWTTGTFTLDTDTIAVSPDCCYPISRMEQEITLDAQMLLMDALRIFDERERDRQAGKTVMSDEELYADVLPSEGAVESSGKSPVITADDLGLGDLDHLERKIPQFRPEDEVFDPAEIHRQEIKEIMAGFSAEEQEAFVSFLEKTAASRGSLAGSQRQEGLTKGLVLFSEDELIKHSVMTICKDEDVLVFATDREEELGRIIDQCLAIKVLPVLVFDNPERREGILTSEKIVSLRQRVRDRYPHISAIQMAAQPDHAIMLQSLRDGVRAVFPKPSINTGRASFIDDTINFLETFKLYVRGLFREQEDKAITDNRLGRLKARILALRGLDGSPAVTVALLQSASEIFERSVAFVVSPSELTGEKAIGVYSGKNAGPAPASKLEVPLTVFSVFRETVETGQFFYGESDDEILQKHLFSSIGAPRDRNIMLLPVKSLGKVAALIYGDFGEKEASPVQGDELEILATGAGLVLENAFYRNQMNKASKK